MIMSVATLQNWGKGKKKEKTWGYLCMDLGAKLTNYFNK
jgi:hypothetical protein